MPVGVGSGMVRAGLDSWITETRSMPHSIGPTAPAPVGGASEVRGAARRGAPMNRTHVLQHASLLEGSQVPRAHADLHPMLRGANGGGPTRGSGGGPQPRRTRSALAGSPRFIGPAALRSDRTDLEGTAQGCRRSGPRSRGAPGRPRVHRTPVGHEQYIRSVSARSSVSLFSVGCGRRGEVVVTRPVPHSCPTSGKAPRRGPE